MSCYKRLYKDSIIIIRQMCMSMGMSTCIEISENLAVKKMNNPWAVVGTCATKQGGGFDSVQREVKADPGFAGAYIPLGGVIYRFCSSPSDGIDDHDADDDDDVNNVNGDDDDEGVSNVNGDDDDVDN